MSQKVLITGATGFIGSQLAEHLLKLGYSVRALVRENSPHRKRIEHLKVEIATGDICQPSTLPKALEGVNKVFHCAAIVSDWGKKEVFHAVNVTGTKNLLDASVDAQVERFVYMSTNDVFGLIEDQVIHEGFPLKPWKEPYPDTKIMAEELVRKYNKEKGLPTASIYACWVYGPHDTTFLPNILDALKKKEMLFWRRNSLMWPTYIENLLDFLVVISEDKRAIGQGYLLHDGQSLTMEDFANRVAQHMGFPEAHKHIPYWAAYTAAIFLQNIWRLFCFQTRPLLTTYVVKNLGSRLQFSIEKAERELGWKPKISFEQGFAKTMEWFKQQKI